MDFLNIINKCLVELNYKPKTSFSELTRNDHTRLKNAINKVNSDVVASEVFWWRQKKTTLTVDTNTEYTLTFDGKITDVYEDDVKYKFDPDYSHFYNTSGTGTSYGFYGGKLLFTPVTTSKTVTIYYNTNNPAETAGGVAKSELSLTDDISIIPERFVESILVNGGCLQFKALVNHPKYQHWQNEYAKAIARLHSECLNTAEDKPRIVMGRSRKASTYSTNSFNRIN